MKLAPLASPGSSRVPSRGSPPPHCYSGPSGPGLEESSMCYNCGCGMPNNDMGNPKNITNKTFEEAAAAMGESPKEAKKNARDLLERVLGSPEERTDKEWKP